MNKKILDYKCQEKIIKDPTRPSLHSYITYRGYGVWVFIDDYGQQFYGIFSDGEEVGFGAYNTEYLETIKYIIDHKADLVYRFTMDDEYYGAELKYFINGGFRDIGLYYRGRLIEVFHFEEDYVLSEEEKQKLIKDARAVLFLQKTCKKNYIRGK